MTATRDRTAIDPLGTLLVAIAVLAWLTLPLMSLRPNRILPGEPHALADVLSTGFVTAVYASLAWAGYVALRVRSAHVRLAVALLTVAVVTVAVAAAASELTPPGNRVVRIAPGGAFWIVILSLGLLATDAITRLRPGPLARVLWLATSFAVVIGALHTGYFDDLSILREHAVNAARFASEVRRHLWLALGSLLAALLVALPVAIGCHRQPRLQGAILGTLNFVQTIPSIALFGILMVPLAALATAWPRLAAFGVSGIGAAPAVVALFLYSLLPIVANTVVGLARVSPAAVDAARGMGMTSTQVLRQVELPLAMPTLLAGVRIVLVQNIGLVTIAALIGGGGLGTFVFQGIGQTAMDLVLLGAVPTVALAFAAAVVLDALTDFLRRVPR